MDEVVLRGSLLVLDLPTGSSCSTRDDLSDVESVDHLDFNLDSLDHTQFAIGIEFIG